MDRAEIVEGLQKMLAEAPYTALLDSERAAARAAIALIEPQPVTEDALREAGFRRLKPGLPAWTLPIGSGRIVGNAAGEFRLDTGEGCIPLHITSMQTLHAVIAALRGTATND